MASTPGRSAASSAPPTAIMPFRLLRTCSSRTSRPSIQTRSGLPISPICGRARVGCISLLCWICLPGGWAVSDRLHKELALEALRKALVIRRPGEGLTHHSDRGSQYCSIEYQATLRKHGIAISMSGKGNCYDNAVVETFFKTLKSELVWRTVFQTRAEANEAIGRYIDGFYNPIRRHSTLDYVSPVQFERMAG